MKINNINIANDITKVISILTNIVEESNSSASDKEDSKTRLEFITINQALKLIHGISYGSLRNLLLNGKIPYIRAGKGEHGKYLISKEGLLQYFYRLNQK